MGRVDEGVEEFFTKRVLPSDTVDSENKPDEESITVQEVAPASAAPCPPQTKTLRRKLGDFFTLKKRRTLKSEASQEGRPKKASIADLIRPLREVARADKEKDKDKVKEHDKENDKEKVKEQPSSVPGEPAVEETPASGVPPLRGDAAPPRRALREGKSQSLILLSGTAAPGTTNARNTAKKSLEGQHSFEQKLHFMLQRIGVSKAQQGEAQNQEGEMKKADSEGTIIDSKPEPPATFTKPRTMSASSDTRHQIRPSVSAHESAGKPALLPKPVLRPGPPPTTSGRNTPENELAQIQEGETNTPTKLSPSASASTSAVPALTAITTVSEVTISNAVPVSTNLTISPSSTVTPLEANVCADSIKAANMSPDDVELNKIPSIPEEADALATKLPTSSLPTTVAGTTTPTEAPVALTVASTECITPGLSVTSQSTTKTMPSVTTLKAASAAKNEGLDSTPSKILSAEVSELSDSRSIDAASAVDSASISTTIAASLPSTSISNVATTISLVTKVSDEPTLATSGSGTSKSSSTIPTSQPANTTTTPDAATNPPSSSLDSSALTLTSTRPSSTTCTKSVSGSTTTQPALSNSADVPPPSPLVSETSSTDTTAITASGTSVETTATSLETTAAIKSPIMTESEPAHTNNITSTLAPTISGLPATDAAFSQDLTGPVQTSTKESVEPAKKSIEEEFEVAPAKEKIKSDQSEVAKGDTKSDKEYDKLAPVNSDIKKEVQEGSMKAEEDDMKKEVVLPVSGKEAEQHSSKETMTGKKQEATNPVDEK